ncbi:MAG: SCO family protein [Stagnimonas sp.]|nr:SCO family protein [Stagnimonas sp.]
MPNWTTSCGTSFSNCCLAEVAREFKIFYRKVPGPTETSYVMEHTAASYLFDPQRRLRLYTRYGMGVKPLADNVRHQLLGS